MRKVLYVIDSLQTGGAEKSLLDISSRLKEFQPVVCHIYKNDFLKAEFERQGVRVVSLDVEGPYDFFKAGKSFLTILKEENPELVIATLLRSELISRVVCRILRIPNVGTFVNDTYSRHEWNTLSRSMKIKVGFFWILNMVSARFCVGFLSNSQSIKESNCKALLVPPKKVDVIYRGRKCEIFKYQKRSNSTAPLRFLAVGRLLYRKGFGELLSAFSAYIRRYSGASLTIAGEGPYRKALEGLIEKFSLQKNVNMPGNVKDVYSLMTTHDVLVFPSHYEGFSGTLVEGMLSGIPIIASDISMNKEAIQHRVTGWLFPVKDVKSLEAAMYWITDNQTTAHTYAHEARKVAERKFDINVIAAQHEQYYKRILIGRS